jgi:hypothetical protein
MTILLTLSLLLLLAAFVCCVYGMAKPTAWPSAVPIAVLLLIIERLLTSLPLK